MAAATSPLHQVFANAPKLRGTYVPARDNATFVPTQPVEIKGVFPGSPSHS
jgi:hypothetical protein